MICSLGMLDTSVVDAGKGTLLRAAAAASLALCILAAPAQALTGQMITGGGSGVGPDGQFGFNLPIDVPPGTAGMAPHLSLNYSSRAGDGIVGYGWSLGGLDAIVRCPRTLTIDGVRGSVNYDSNDKFCLNGQRLMVTSGTYGASGSVYYGYINGYSQITAHSAAGSGPDYFTIKLKNGTTLELGNSADSKIEASSTVSTVSAWLVNKVIDVKGNYLTVTYTEDQTNGQYYPSRIDYTANDGSSPALTNYNSVQFSYDDRDDKIPTYQTGYLRKITKRLSHIKTYVGASVISDYQLTYRDGTASLHSRLTSVKQCDAAGTKCFAPTTFDWQGGAGLPTMNSATSMSSLVGHPTAAGDFNADGLLDAVNIGTTCPTGGLIYFGANATPNVGSFSTGNMDAEYYYWKDLDVTEYHYNSDACFPDVLPRVLDIDADGYSDIALYQTYWHKLEGDDPDLEQDPFTSLMSNNKTGKLTQYSINPLHLLPEMSILGDFNGDGYPDGFANGTSSLYLGDGAGALTFSNTVANTGAGFTVYTGDFDGDGCKDLMTQGTSVHQLIYSCNPAAATGTASIAAGKVVGGDFNGDGKTDYMVIPSSGSALLYLSDGINLGSAITVSGSTGWYSYVPYTGDFNGDGRTDLLLIGSSTAHQIYLSQGTDFALAGTISNSAAGISASTSDWNNDGGSDIWLETSGTDQLYTFQFAPERIVAVHNGIGATTSITYDRLNQNSPFYTKSGTGTFPDRELDGSYYVVSRIAVDDGAGITAYHTDYTYQDAIYDVTVPPAPKTASDLPGGFLTFTKLVATDSRSGSVTTTTFRTDLPYVGLRSLIEVKNGTTTLNSTAYTYANVVVGGSNAIQLTKTVSTRNDLDAAALPTVETDYGYDDYNNITSVVTKLNGTTYSTVTNDYTNDTTAWILGKQTLSTVHNVVGASDITRHFTFTPSTQGFTTNAYAEPSDTGALKLEADYGYDYFGNPSTTALLGNGLTSRTNTVNWDSKGQFPTGMANALSQTTGVTFDTGFGEMTSYTDDNGHTTTATPDTLGRPTDVAGPDGNHTAITYSFCFGVNGGTTTCPAHGAYLVKTQPQNTSNASNGAATWTYYDSMGRAIQQDIQSFNSALARTATQYDAGGRVLKISRPYFASGTPVWTTYSYDALDRVTSVVSPDTSTTSYCYHGLISSVKFTWSATSQIKSTTLNTQGLVASTTDGANVECTSSTTLTGVKTSFVYDAFGNPLTIADDAGNVVTNTFDVRGRKTGMVDPDMGGSSHPWSFTYDGLSELKSQTDAKGQTMSFAYDLLMRLLTRTESSVTTRKLVYDTATNGVGMLADACSANPCSTAAYAQIPTYDSQGRLATDRLKLDGTNYTYSYTYNGDGRLDTLSYPSGFVAKYAYTSTGYLSQIKDNASSSVIWQADATDAELHITQQTTGNGVVTTAGYDANTGRVQNICASTSSGSCLGDVANYAYDWDGFGNLIDRSDTYQGYTEKFCYDGLNRLTRASMNATCDTVSRKVLAYDDIGNLTRKSDVCNTANCYVNGGTGYGPHQLASIVGTYNGVTNPTFTYDANGNMTSGGGFTFSYTSTNMAKTVAEGTTTAELTYGAYDNRYKMCTPDCTTPTATKKYLYDPVTGAGSELVSGASTTYIDYVTAPGAGIVAVRSKTGSTVSWLYTVGDHLGSIAAITDTNTPPTVTRQSFDIWGKRRNANGTDNAACTLTSPVSRGYTSHEMLDDYCFVNANARIYDPSLGRFHAADSVVADPGYSQSYNRYAYTYDNPLAFTDPTGQSGQGTERGRYKYWIKCFNSCAAFGGYSENGGGYGFSTDPIPDGNDPWDNFGRAGPLGEEWLGSGGFNWGGGDPHGGWSHGGSLMRGDAGERNPIETVIVEAKRLVQLPQKQVTFCSALPAGRTIGGNYSLGGFGGATGAAEMVLNYKTGERSAFLAGGFFTGWNGGVSASGYTGYIFGNLGDHNEHYAGGFTTYSLAGNLGGFVSHSSSGIAGPFNLPKQDALVVAGVSLGVNAFETPTGGIAATTYSDPISLGRGVWAGDVTDLLFYTLQQFCR